jgi:hypothetical protein
MARKKRGPGGRGPKRRRQKLPPDKLQARKAPGSWATSRGHEETLLEPHTPEFDMPARPRKGWVVVGLEGVQSDDQLWGWVRRAVKFVGALPAKD